MKASRAASRLVRDGSFGGPVLTSYWFDRRVTAGLVSAEGGHGGDFPDQIRAVE